MSNSKKAVVSMVTALLVLCMHLSAQIVEKEDDTWVVDVPAGACVRPTTSDFASLAGEAVHKRGEGRLVLTRTAARDVDLVYETGSLELVCAQEVAEDWYYRAETAVRVGNVTQSIRTETGDPFEIGGGALAVGTNASWGSTVTSRKVPVRLDGKMSISGRVTLSGTGAWGLAIVLHNDLRGYEAKGTQVGNEGLCYAQTTDPIMKSFAVGFVNFHKKDYFGRYRIGRNGRWTETATTDPMIFFNTADTTVTPEVAHARVFDFVLASDTSSKTVTLTLTQEQDGKVEPVVFTRTWTGADLSEICGCEKACLAFTSATGGRTTSVVIDGLEVAYASDRRFGIVTDGVLSLPTGSILSLDAVDFGIDRNGKVARETRAELSRGARLRTSPGVTAALRSVTVSGETIRRGMWTASDCDWVEGLGSVVLGAGFSLIVR